MGVIGKTPVHVLNISLGGMGVEGPQALRVGSTHRVTISGHGEMLELSGTVRWCRMSISGAAGAACRTAYSAGMSFEGLRPEDLQSLYSFIAAELAERASEPERR